MCKFIATLIVDTLQRFLMEDTDPTGAIRLGAPCPQLSHWSTRARPERTVGISIVNDFAVKNEGVVVERNQGALYVHVDDGLCLFAGDPPRGAREVKIGFPDSEAGASRP